MAETISITSSTGINKADYDKTTKTLRVYFNTGKDYSYYGVPETVWVQFKDAKSKGSFFSKQIKGKYTAEKYLFV
jgi:hypothetical protein